MPLLFKKGDKVRTKHDSRSTYIVLDIRYTSSSQQQQLCVAAVAYPHRSLGFYGADMFIYALGYEVAKDENTLKAMVCKKIMAMHERKGYAKSI